MTDIVERTDIIERLRSYLVAELDTSDDAARERDNLIAEAADEIKRLRDVLSKYAESQVYGARAREVLAANGEAP
jgi:hypothetical protein